MGRSRSRSRERRRSPERWSKRSRSRSRSSSGERSRRTRRRSGRRSESPPDEEAWKREADRREEARQRWSVSPERKNKKDQDKNAAAAAVGGGAAAAPVYEPGSIEAQMAAMGLPVDFASTKGKHVEGNDDFVVADIPHQRKHRQYMNKKITKSEKERVRVPIRR